MSLCHTVCLCFCVKIFLHPNLMGLSYFRVDFGLFFVFFLFFINVSFYTSPGPSLRPSNSCAHQQRLAPCCRRGAQKTPWSKQCSSPGPLLSIWRVSSWYPGFSPIVSVVIPLGSHWYTRYLAASTPWSSKKTPYQVGLLSLGLKESAILDYNVLKCMMIHRASLRFKKRLNFSINIDILSVFFWTEVSPNDTCSIGGNKFIANATVFPPPPFFFDIIY